MNHELKDRLNLVINHYNLAQNELARMADVSPSTVSNAVNSGKIGEQILFAILNNFPNVSAEWLLRGTGEMLLGLTGEEEDARHMPPIDPAAVAVLIERMNGIKERMDIAKDDVELFQRLMIDYQRRGKK
jgi:transcriptional regulator with XRE-family HTH domain